MEALYKIKAKDLDKNWLESIKKLFGDKEVVIKVSSEMDETEYLTLYPANKEHLLENMDSGEEERFAGEEFQEYVKNKTN